MALEKEDIDKLKADLKKVYSKTRGQFLYCPASKTGDPILVLSPKKITADQIKTVRENARVKTFVRGRIALEDGDSGKELVFYTKTDPPGKLVKHVKQFFGRSLSKLKKAVFKKIETEAVNSDDANEFAEEGDVAGIQDENASFSVYDSKNSAEIQNDIVGLDRDTRQLERRRQEMLAKAEELQYKILVEGKKAFRNKEEMAEAEAQAAAIRREADQVLLEIEAKKEQSAEAHAQLQNRFADEKEAEYERRLAELDQGVDADVLKHFLNEEAQKEELVAQRQADVVDIQNRLAQLHEQERSQVELLKSRENKVKGKIAETGDVERGNRLLRKIEDERLALMSNLQTYRLEVDKLQAEYLLSHAMSDRMMDKLDSRVRDHWAQQNNVEDQHVYNTRVQGLMEAEEPYHDAREKVREIEQDIAQDNADISTLARSKESLELTIAELQRETEQSDKRIVKIQARLGEVEGDTAKTERFTKRLDEERKRREEYQKGIFENRTRLSRVSQEHQDLIDGLPAKEKQLGEARQVLNEKQVERNKLLLSEPERATVEMIAAREQGALDKAAAAKQALETKRQELAAHQAKVSAFKSSEQEFLKINALLVAKQAEYSRQKELSEKWKLPWRNTKEIDAARAELPALEAELETLKQAFNAKRADFENKKANYSEADIQAAFNAEQEILRFEKEAAEADALALEMKEQRLQNESQLAAMSHDIYEQRLENTKNLLIDNLDGFKERYATAERNLAHKETEYENATATLIDEELRLEELREELNVPMDIDSFNTKLTAFTDQESAVNTALEAVQTVQGELDQLNQQIDNINTELRTQAEGVKDEQTEKGSIARHYLQSIEAVANSADDEADILNEAVAVHEVHEQAEVDRNNAQRKAGLIEDNRQVALSIQNNRKLIDKFNRLTGDENAKAYDLMLPDDRKELKKKNPAAYEKLKSFTQELEERSLGMIAKGASLEELQTAFAEIPNGLRPASFREEVARFHQVSRLLEEEQNETNVLEAAHKRAVQNKTREQYKESITKNLTALGEVLGDIDTVNNEIAEGISTFIQNYDTTEVGALKDLTGEDKSNNNETIQAIDDFVGSATAVFGLGSSVLEVGQSIYERRNMDIMDPIEKKMANDKLLDSLLGMGEQTLNTIKQFTTMGENSIPNMGLIGVFLKTEEMGKAIVEASSRRILAARDSMLQEAAKLANSPMASALEETKVQERQLFIKYGIKAATTAAGIAADLMAAFPGPQQAVGAALNVVTWLVDKAVTLKLNDVKKKQIKEARELLRRAKKGDAEAKTLLFQKHAVYAKGMIAAMALERDSFAMNYVQTRGLNDAEIQASSFKIISRYLLDKAEQSADDFDVESESTKWRDRVLAFKSFIRKIVNLFGVAAYEMEGDSRLDDLKTFYNRVAELDELHDNAVKILPKLKEKKLQVLASGSKNQTYVNQVNEVEAFIADHKEIKAEIRTELVDWGNKVAGFRHRLDAMDELELEPERYDELEDLNKEQHRISKVVVPTLEQFVLETGRVAI